MRFRFPAPSGLFAGYFGGASVGGAIAGANKSDAELQHLVRVGGLVGGAIGGVLGYLHQTTRWEALSLRTVRPTLLSGMVIRVAGEGLPGTDP